MLYHVDPRHGGPAGIGEGQRGQDPHRCGLAGAVRAEQAKDRPGGHGEADTGQGPGLPVVLGQPLGLDHRPSFPTVTHVTCLLQWHPRLGVGRAAGAVAGGGSHGRRWLRGPGSCWSSSPRFRYQIVSLLRRTAMHHMMHAHMG